jgi:hypothetical protein
MYTRSDTPSTALVALGVLTLVPIVVTAQTAPAAKVRADAVTLSGPTVAGSFCSTAEVAVFHCSTGAKQVSVCASRTATPAAGSLRYFFGKPGATPEIMLPAKATPPSRSASADTLMYSGGGGAWLRFRSGEYAYTVFTAMGRWGEGGAPAEREGLLVERKGKRVAYLPCRRAAESRLGPAFYEKLGLKTATPDESFDLPD